MPAPEIQDLKIAVVILNYNGERHLKTFLPSVIKHCPAGAEVIVADNASTDGSLSFLRENYPQIRLIEMRENTGFAGGYNTALKEVDAEYFALVNSDVEVTERWLETLTDYLDKHPDTAAVQPKIKAFRLQDHFEYAGASGGFIDGLGFPFCRGRMFDRCERDTGQHDEPREVFWTTGACMVIRAEAFLSAGGFDPDLFAHMEEIDLCWRLKNKGAELFCIPQAEIFHLGGGTLSSQNPRKTYLNFRNNLIVMIKNDYRKGFLGRLLLRMVFDGGGALHLLFRKGFGHFTAVVRAHLYIYMNMNKLRAKRKTAKTEAVKPNLTGLYRGRIVADYFFRKRQVFNALPPELFVRKSPNHRAE